jgi:hypothetical protein
MRFRRVYKQTPQLLLRYSRVDDILCTTCMDAINNQELLASPPGNPLSWFVTIFYPCTLLLHEPWVSDKSGIPYLYIGLILLVLPCMHLLCEATFLFIPPLLSRHHFQPYLMALYVQGLRSTWRLFFFAYRLYKRTHSTITSGVRRYYGTGRLRCKSSPYEIAADRQILWRTPYHIHTNCRSFCGKPAAVCRVVCGYILRK